MMVCVSGNRDLQRGWNDVMLLSNLLTTFIVPRTIPRVDFWKSQIIILLRCSVVDLIVDFSIEW
jgi:hypothetical protein